MHYKNKTILSYRYIVPALVLTQLFCAPPLRQFYRDSYYPQDNIYENKSLRFTLIFRGNWEITTDPTLMHGPAKSIARSLQLSNAELLFAGNTIEGSNGARGIASNLNQDNETYAQRIRAINKPDINKDLGATAFETPLQTMVKWEYCIGDFHFAEFFFSIDTYNVRVAFWTKEELFPNFLPVYEDIMATLSYTSGF